MAPPAQPDGVASAEGGAAASAGNPIEMVRLVAPDLTAQGDAPIGGQVQGHVDQHAAQQQEQEDPLASPVGGETGALLGHGDGDKANGGGASHKGETDLPAAYLSYLSALQSAWPDLPDLTITYDKLSYEVRVPRRRHDHIPTIANAIGEKIRRLNVFRDRSADTQLFHPLHPCSGVVRSGELTLVLAPPGHGKSALLKALSGRLVQEGSAVTGSVRWNGLDAQESAAAGQQLSKLCAFVEQGDVHFPMLTVRETFQFALDNSNADAALLGSPDFDALQKRKVELLTELLGLKECADTVVGNAMIRGVSGGQKKRVTLGEMMIGQARALFLDEISTGLDSAATFDITSALRRWTRVMRGSAVVALLQPAPEVLALFDNLILLREGHIVFSGTQAELRQHLSSCGITPNPNVDFADWLTSFLTDPPAVWKRDVEARSKQSGISSFRKSFREEHSHDTHGSGQQHGQQGKHFLAPPVSASPIAASPVASPAGNERSGSANQVGDAEAERGPPEVVFHIGSDEAFEDGHEHAYAHTRGLPHARVSSPAGVQVQVEGKSVRVDDGVDGSPSPSPNGNGHSNGQENGAGRRKGLGRVVTSKGVPLSTTALAQRYEASAVYKDLIAEIQTRNDALRQGTAKNATSKSAASPFTLAQFYQKQSWGAWHHTRTCLRRQWQFMSRSPTFIIPRIVQCVFMGLVAGSLFYQLDPSLFAARYGLILFSLTFLSFVNMAEVPLASEFKKVVAKQVDSGFYSPASYVFSVIIMHLPLSIIECGVLGTILYWMSGFTPDVGRWSPTNAILTAFFYLLVLLCMNSTISALFRSVAYVSRNPDVASNTSGPLTAVFLLFGGFLITKDKVPNWLIEFYWLSPFRWGMNSIALNEFKSERFSDEEGDAYLDAWQMPKDDAYKWAGVGYLIGLFMVCIGLGVLALTTKRAWLTVGTRRSFDESPEALDSLGDSADTNGEVEVRVGAKTTSMAVHDAEARQREEESRLPFTRMDLAFVDLRYSVVVTEQDDAGVKRTYERSLLQGINGYAKAGELTALMGSSGAGKTTLMDVIAGRKNMGKITGDILIDGQPQSFPSFNRLMGYVEQSDNLVGQHTVRETLEFSAKLRLPASVSAEARDRFVAQILDDLELTPLANRVVGDASLEGLAPGELKRVTIGVELAANPTFLFLDEPTSGLDSRAALIVLRVIRKIASRGRSVVCTIHQPSAELFYMFDKLLLLKSGGKEVYFGPVGDEGVEVVKYFMNADLDPKYYRPSLPEAVNVASWMLDVIGAGTSAKGLIAPYDEVYKNSELREENMAEVRRVAQPKQGKDAEAAAAAAAQHGGIYAASYSTQFYCVLHRLFTVYYRDVSYSLSKAFLMGFLGVLFGLVYRDIDDSDEAGLISKLSVLFLVSGNVGVLQCSNALPIIFRLREVFYRERAANTYAPWVYSTAIGIVELPYLFICVMVFTIPLYFLVGFLNDGEKFFQFLLTLFLVAIYFCYLGQLYASLFPSQQVAQIFAGLTFTFVHLFGGVFIQKNAIPVGWEWMYHMNPIPKSMIALSVQQFYCPDSDPTCPQIYSLQLGGRTVSTWTFVSHYLATGNGWDYYYWGWLCLMIVVVRLFVAVVIQKVSHIKR